VAGVETRDFDSPDETRTPAKTQVDVVRIGATAAYHRRTPPFARQRTSPSQGVGRRAG
jgi:hypothetical protein